MKQGATRPNTDFAWLRWAQACNTLVIAAFLGMKALSLTGTIPRTVSDVAVAVLFAAVLAVLVLLLVGLIRVTGKQIPPERTTSSKVSPR